MKILATLSPREGERELVAKYLDVTWLVDDPNATGDILLSMWPHRELRNAGRDIEDVHDAKFVQLITAGANHMGWNHWPEAVPVATAPGATAPAIGEYVLGAILAWARGFTVHTHAIRAGRFSVGHMQRRLRDLHVGFVGFGNISRSCIDLLAPHGVRISAVSRNTPSDDRLSFAGDMHALSKLAAQVDVLVLALPQRNDTIGIIDANILNDLGDGLLLNVARGPIVNEDSLFAHAKSRPDFHAHLDVWWQYPKEGHPFSRPFHELENITMTPHNAPNVPGFREPMLEQACRNIQAFLEGNPQWIERPSDYV